MHSAHLNRESGAFEELEVVRTRAAMRIDGHRLPSGSLGAIVLVHAGGQAFEVEFTTPVAAVVTLAAGDIEPAA